MARLRCLTKTSSQLTSLSRSKSTHTKRSATAATTVASAINAAGKSIAGCSLQEDAALIAALVRGTTGAEQCFANRHDAFLRSVVRSSSPHAARFVDDLTHEVYVYLWRHSFHVLRRWERKAPLQAYLRSIIRRLVWERLGELRPRHELLDNDPMAGFDLPSDQAMELPPTAEELVVARETRERVQRALGCLDSAYRQVIELRYYRDLSYRDMAELLGIDPIQRWCSAGESPGLLEAVAD